MSKKHQLNILNISFYGAPVAETKQTSGALLRQKDYAQYVEKYVMVVAGKPGTQVSEMDIGDGLMLYTLPSKGYFSFFIQVLKHVKKLHKEHAFDVVMVDNPHIAGMLGILVSRTLNIPAVVHSMADMPYNKWFAIERPMNRVKEVVARSIVHFTDYLRISTHAEVARLTAKGISKKKLLHIPFYIDADSFSEQLNKAESTYTTTDDILFVGRLGEQKDLAVLLRAFKDVHKSHDKARLVLVGGGPLESQLKTLAKSLDIDAHVTFTGSIPYEEVARTYKNAKLFAISSLYEGTCMVLHEAGLARLPIVSTNFAGAKDYVRDGVEGYLVPVRDHKALAEKILKVLQGTPDARKKMGNAAYERVEEFSKKKALVQWENLCKILTGQKEGQ